MALSLSKKPAAPQGEAPEAPKAAPRSAPKASPADKPATSRVRRREFEAGVRERPAPTSREPVAAGTPAARPTVRKPEPAQEYASSLLVEDDLAVVVNGEKVGVSNPYFEHFSQEARNAVWGNYGARLWMRKVAQAELAKNGVQVGLEDIIIPVAPLVSGKRLELPLAESPEPAQRPFL